ncbi:MAG TPA: DUF4168 domain-containing protein [Nevskiaceae bacterium]
MNQPFHRIGVTAAVVLGLGVLAPGAFAQTGAPAAQAPQQQAAPGMAQPDTGPAPSDSELKHFVAAALDVQHIARGAEPQIEAAKSAADRANLQQAAEKKMEAAVKKQHLSVQRYQQIAMVIQTNHSVQAKVNQMLRAKAQH